MSQRRERIKAHIRFSAAPIGDFFAGQAEYIGFSAASVYLGFNIEAQRKLFIPTVEAAWCSIRIRTYRCACACVCVWFCMCIGYVELSFGD